jgi:hypothetical protein
MFGFGKQDVAVLEKPKAVKLPVPEFSEEYDTLSKEFDLYDQHRLAIAINSMFNQLDVPIYSIDAVEDYMEKTLIKERRIQKQRNLEWKWVTLDSAYNKLIPAYILKRAKLVKEAMNDVRFPVVREYITTRPSVVELQVTDYEVVNPDPFIAVNFNYLGTNSKHRWARGYKVVFGVWDEPGFN